MIGEVFSGTARGDESNEKDRDECLTRAQKALKKECSISGKNLKWKRKKLSLKKDRRRFEVGGSSFDPWKSTIIAELAF